MRAKIFKSLINGLWYFRLVARNNKTVAQSEGYNRRRSAVAAVNAIRRATITISK